MKYPDDFINKIVCGNALEILKEIPSESVNCCVCSPPYWGLRDYGVEPVIWDGDKDCEHIWGSRIITLKHKSGETNPGKESWFKDKGASDDKGNCFCFRCNAWRGSLGLEPTFELYIKHLCDIFDEVKRVLRKDGTCWVNLGDTYGGSGNRKGHTLETSNLNRLTVGYGATEGNQKATKGYEKSLLMIPQRFAIKMVNRGWILRNTIIWHKANCMPSSAKDRFTVDFEDVFFFTKNNKAIFWTNEKTLECVSKKPLGVKGIEGKDWEYREVGVISKDSFNVRVRDTEKNKYTQKATIEEKENYKKPKLKKVSLWAGHDYWFEQQFEEHMTQENRPDGIVRNRIFNYDSKLNKLRGFKTKQIEEEIQGPQYHGKDINYGKQGRNKRAVWTIPTQPFPEAHFAVYPETLIEPMIKAGCPRYVCKKCGKARVKVYEKSKMPEWDKTHKNNAIYKLGKTSALEIGGPRYNKWKEENPDKFIGYTDCGCNAGWESGITLDPFIGAGTTALVALEQRKRFIGIEIKQEYIDMSYKRIAKVQQEIF